MNTRKSFTRLLMLFMAMLLVIFVAGCGGGGGGDGSALGSGTDKSITAYSLAGVTGTIDETAKTIAVTMPNGINVTALIATFTTTGTGVTIGAAVQTSGATPNDFTNPVAYIVTAADGTTATYTVTVAVAPITAKAITAYSLAGVTGTINETAKTIAVNLPSGTNITALVATFSTTGINVTVGASVQTSGTTVNDFSSPVAYTVTAVDGSTATYNVAVVVASLSAKAVTAYSLAGVTGTIDEAAKAISVSMPYGTSVTALIATFTSTGASVKVGAKTQISGTTPNDFTAPVAYIITGADGSTVSYTVTVSIALNSAKAITAYSLAGVTGVIDEAAKTISVSMPTGTNLTALVATFTSTGANVKVGVATQISGTTANDFNSPVAYIVTAADSTTLTYTVSVTTPVAVAAARGPAPVPLGLAGNFVILAKTAVSTTGTTSVVGNIGVSPAAASYITGFSLIMDSTNAFSTSSLVTGNVYASDYAVPTPDNMTTAISDMETAFTDAAGRATPDFTELYAGDISGRTLVPGLYKWGTGVLITGVGVTLSGGPNDVWIFQIAQDLTVSNSAMITLSGGAQAKNIFWQVSGQATIGTAADFKGIILSQTLISLNTGAVMTGRALAQSAVTLDANAVTKPAP
ncbi:MAG: ice-binding family protein [Gallionella sp.]|nr:ice-binding family protein [Gallionella sp.]